MDVDMLESFKASFFFKWNGVILNASTIIYKEV